MVPLAADLLQRLVSNVGGDAAQVERYRVERYGADHVGEQEDDPLERVAGRRIRQVDREAETDDEDQVGEHCEDVADGDDAQLEVERMRLMNGLL